MFCTLSFLFEQDILGTLQRMGTAQTARWDGEIGNSAGVKKAIKIDSNIKNGLRNVI